MEQISSANTNSGNDSIAEPRPDEEKTAIPPSEELVVEELVVEELVVEELVVEELVVADLMSTDSPSAETGNGARGALSALGTVLKEVLQVVVPAVLLALAIHIFLAQATVVYGQSMQPNLQPAERLVIEKISYYFAEPQRDDIVVLNMPQMPELLIKRVVGLPGEVVEIRRGTVLINGQTIDQSFVMLSGGTTYGPVTLGADSYFVMGDNRNNSNDSRSFGPVQRDKISGKAWLRYWPLNRFTLFD